jgi:nucleotide-binding universal stress UspA family protein
MRTADWRSELSVIPEPMTLRNILLATDFSESSARALDYALGIASRYEAQLYVFHCIDPAPYSLADPEVIWKTRDDAQRELEDLVLGLHRQRRARNLDVKVVIEVGKIIPFLSQAVKTLELGLIVVGTHGRTGWKKIALGSVAEIVIDEVSCPVVSVAPSAYRTRTQEYGLANILLVTEASMRSRLAESYAFSLARKYNSRLSVVDVLEGKAGRVIAQVSQLKLSDAGSPDVSNTELTNSLVLPPDIGNQSDLVLQVADRTGADLIVLAVSETYRFTDRVFSTNSYRVVSSAPCPVLTVRAR